MHEIRLSSIGFAPSGCGPYTYLRLKKFHVMMVDQREESATIENGAAVALSTVALLEQRPIVIQSIQRIDDFGQVRVLHFLQTQNCRPHSFDFVLQATQPMVPLQCVWDVLRVQLRLLLQIVLRQNVVRHQHKRLAVLIVVKAGTVCRALPLSRPMLRRIMKIMLS